MGRDKPAPSLKGLYMNIFESTRIVPAISPQSIASASVIGTYVGPIDVDRVAIQVASGVMADGNSVTVELLQAKDSSGTSSKIIPIGRSYVVPGIPEKFSFSLAAPPADGTSITFSGRSTVEDKFQLWFNFGGMGTAPAPAVGYNLKGPVLDASANTQPHLTSFMTAQFGTEVTASLVGSVITFTNATKGAVTAPADVDTGITPTVIQVGTNDTTIQPEVEYVYTASGAVPHPPIIMIDMPLTDLDQANGFNYLTAKITTHGAVNVAAYTIFYWQKVSREYVPQGKMW